MQVPIGPEGTATVVLDSSGDGTAKVGPAGMREIWQPALASVQCSSNTDEATCQVAFGQDLATARFLDATFTGSSGDSTDRVSGAAPLRLGWSVFATWTGGDPGATATLTVTGTKTI